MNREVAKGALLMTPQMKSNPLKETAKRLQLPDDYRQKLRDRIDRKKGSK